MKTRGLMVTLALSALFAAACGPSRGVRLESTAAQTNQDNVGGGSSAKIRVRTGTGVAGIPTSLASSDRRLFTSVTGLYGLRLQAIDTRTGKALGAILLPYYASYVSAKITSTPNTIWMLVPVGYRSELIHLDLQDPETAGILRTAGRQWGIRGLRKHILTFPADTSFVGMTKSVLWFVSHTVRGYTLQRLDMQTSAVTRFELASAEEPGVAIVAGRIFVLLRSGEDGSVLVQSRAASGKIVATSSMKIPGFQGRRLAACGNQIFGWTRDTRGVTIFAMSATGGPPRYSKRLPPFDELEFVNAIVLSDHCRTVWVATSYDGLGVVSRLRASSLAVTGQINTAYIRTLLWMDGSLWGASPDQRRHHAHSLIQPMRALDPGLQPPVTCPPWPRRA